MKYYSRKYNAKKIDLDDHFALLGKVCNSLQHPVSIQHGQQIV